MHYEQITRAALCLGFLESGSGTPEICMSSELSKEVASNPDGIIERTGRGVYRIKAAFREARFRLPENDKALQLGMAILHRRFRAAPSSVILRRALVLLSRVMDRGINCDAFLMIGEKGEATVAAETLNEQLFGIGEQLNRLNEQAVFERIHLDEDMRHLLRKLHRMSDTTDYGEIAAIALKLLAVGVAMSPENLAISIVCRGRTIGFDIAGGQRKGLLPHEGR